MERILPAIIPKSAAHLTEVLATLSFANAIQIDVVDGKFAEPASWPYEPLGSPSEVKDTLQEFDVEVDLMVENPLEAVRAWRAVGARRFIFHIETLTGPEPLAALRKDGAVVGCSLSNTTPLASLDPYFPVADFIQVMGIAKIGGQGQTFDERALFRVAQLKARFPTLTISVDGSVNEETLPRLRAAGAVRFAVGSAILAADDPVVSYHALASLLS